MKSFVVLFTTCPDTAPGSFSPSRYQAMFVTVAWAHVTSVRTNNVNNAVALTLTPPGFGVPALAGKVSGVAAVGMVLMP